MNGILFSNNRYYSIHILTIVGSTWFRGFLCDCPAEYARSLDVIPFIYIPNINKYGRSLETTLIVYARTGGVI
jgi:hypothetical protein